MSTVELGSTLTLFAVPHHLTPEQQGIFTLVLAMVNELCIENPDYDGRDVYPDFTGEIDHETEAAINNTLKNFDLSIYVGMLETGKYKIGVVGKGFSQRRLLELLKAS